MGDEGMDGGTATPNAKINATIAAMLYLKVDLTMRKILILSANPKSASRLRLDEEVREIELGLERKRQEQFEIISKWAVRPDDLRRALLDYDPQIVHFSGHGIGDRGLVLENSEGEIQLVSAESLANLFKLFKDKIECVVLNACYSEVQAKAIAEHINCVVGMNQEIDDRAAVKFAVGFYDALGAGRTYEDAFEFGCNSIDLAGIPEASIPVLKLRDSTHERIKNIVSHQQYPLENPEGQVPLESAFYIDRPPIELDCYESILSPGALIRIKAPRQMGKSSLMTRIIDRATAQGYLAAGLNFQDADRDVFVNLDRFLQWFCSSISEELNLVDKVSSYWDGVLGSKSRCTKYFEKYLLPNMPDALVLALDDVDEVFKHPDIASDFFMLLRSWHEKGKNEPMWEKLRLIIVHSKEVYIPLNLNHSPFNVGLPVELSELTQLQVRDLVERHNLQLTHSELERVIQLVGGHPYLIRVILYEIARRRSTLDKFIEIAPTEEGAYSEHLRRHLLSVQKHPDLVTALTEVVTATVPVDIGATRAFRLRSMGLVKFRGNAVMPLCDLYRVYFKNRLEVNL
jgi:hypothetical protein